jgi:hypothetical protein
MFSFLPTFFKNLFKQLKYEPKRSEVRIIQILKLYCKVREMLFAEYFFLLLLNAVQNHKIVKTTNSFLFNFKNILNNFYLKHSARLVLKLI